MGKMIALLLTVLLACSSSSKEEPAAQPAEAKKSKPVVAPKQPTPAPTPAPTPTPAPATPAPAKAATDFVEYAPKAAGFRMQYIHAPRESSKESRVGAVKITMRSAYANKEGLFQVLQFFELPANYKSVMPENKPSQILRNFVEGSMENKEITKVDETKDYKHEGRVAFLYRATNAAKEGLVVRAYLDGRTVVMTGLIAAGAYPSAKDLATYLESFRFAKK